MWAVNSYVQSVHYGAFQKLVMFPTASLVHYTPSTSETVVACVVPTWARCCTLNDRPHFCNSDL